jgi:Zn-dependent M28 family amino/carboxypeptidase
MPGKKFRGKIPLLLPEELMLRDKLRDHVEALAVTIGERSIATPDKLRQAESYVVREFQQLGYKVWQQPFKFRGLVMHNYIVVKEGTNPRAGSIVVGAHYDTVPGTPGADDNATGVGALIELARWLRHQQFEKTIRLVAFANEENSGGPWETMGSYHFAQLCKQKGYNVKAMLSLEMLGVFSDTPGSQQYPDPFGAFYPRTANFIAFVGNQMSRALVHECVGHWRGNVAFPCEGVAAPDKLRDAGRSDHWSFWQIGVPALMITDTSNFRYPLYHTREDTPDKIDFDRYTRVVSGVCELVRKLGG